MQPDTFRAPPTINNIPGMLGSLVGMDPVSNNRLFTCSAEEVLAVISCPTMNEQAHSAVLLFPPSIADKEPEAVLLQPPLTVAHSPEAVFS